MANVKGNCRLWVFASRFLGLPTVNLESTFNSPAMKRDAASTGDRFSAILMICFHLSKGVLEVVWTVVLKRSCQGAERSRLGAHRPPFLDC